LDAYALPRQTWHEGWTVLCDAFDISTFRGPATRLLTLRAPTWAVVTALEGAGRLTIGSDSVIELDQGSFVMLAPGAVARLEAGEGASIEVVAAPGQTCAEMIVADTPEATTGGVWWLFHTSDLEPALAPRDKVKLSEANLWRPAAPPGLWTMGHEVRCDAMSFGFFRTGAPESTHKHERTWELYQVLEGALQLSVRDYRLGAWVPVTVTAGQLLLLPPGAGHLVDQHSRHLSAVFQSPPAISDHETVSYRPTSSSLELPFDE
jgi:quercetin dioxygenase-like cupin family protein